MSAELREPPSDAVEQVAKLSRRTAHATYALFAYSQDHTAPAYAKEVAVYDQEALSVHATASGLANAQKAGLVERWPNPGDLSLWTLSPLGHDLASALEDRFLEETDHEPA